MRAFVEADLGPQLTSRVRPLISELRGRIKGRIKWQKSEDLHLTLEFLGEISSKEQTKAQRAIKKTAQAFKPFSIGFEKLKTFSRKGRISHIWLSIGNNRSKLCQLQAELAQNLKDSGLKTDKRKYLPHLTLARVKRIDSESRDETKQLLKGVEVNLPELIVNKLSLTQSLLKPEKACYNRVSFYYLID